MRTPCRRGRARVTAALLLLAGCAPAPTAPSVAPALPATFSCGPAADADFEGAGEARLQGFVAWLAYARGAPAGISPARVSLAIVRGPAKPGPSGVQAGEISCAGPDGPYRITLYRDALAGRPLAVAYDTLAHEFHHLVQIHRDRLPCGPTTIAAHEAYEREAREAARRIVPACR